MPVLNSITKIYRSFYPYKSTRFVVVETEKPVTVEAVNAALKEAAEAGVEILAYDCCVQVGKVYIDKKVPVNLS